MGFLKKAVKQLTGAQTATLIAAPSSSAKRIVPKWIEYTTSAAARVQFFHGTNGVAANTEAAGTCGGYHAANGGYAGPLVVDNRMTPVEIPVGQSLYVTTDAGNLDVYFYYEEDN